MLIIRVLQAVNVTCTAVARVTTDLRSFIHSSKLQEDWTDKRKLIEMHNLCK
jgi:hypothetical protein